MGKACSAAWLVLTLSLAIPIAANAETVDNLYSFYNIDTSDYSDAGAEQTVKDYEKIKKFVAMYNYIDLSAPDTASQDILVQQLESRIDEINDELYRGFDLTFAEILELESEQADAYKQIQRVNSTREYVNVEINIPDADNVPTYEEYMSAKKRLKELESTMYIGDVSNIEIPVSPYGKILSHNSDSTVISTSIGSDALSVFNGVVTDVSDNCVSVKSGNDIVVTYSGLLSTNLQNGDYVGQYSRIGTTPKTFEIILEIQGTRYDLGRLFDE